MVMVPGVVVCGSGSDGVDIGAGSSFDTGDNMLAYMDIDDKSYTAAETGIDHNHWFVLFKNHRSKESPRQETIKLSLRLLAQVVGKERAPTSLYGVDNYGFGCQVSEEEARKFWRVDGVSVSFVDSFRCGPNGEHLGEYSLPEHKFPGPDDDDLSGYRKYLDDWEAEHGGCVFFPHYQQPVKVREEVDPQELKYRMKTLETQFSMWDAQQEAYKDGFTLVTPKKFNNIKKQLMEKLGRQATEEEVKIALEMRTLRKCAEQAVEQEARDREVRKQALEKWEQDLDKWEQDLEVRKQAQEKQLQEKQAQEKQLQEKQAQEKQLQEKQAKEALEKQAKQKEALEKQANRKQAKKRAKRKKALEKWKQDLEKWEQDLEVRKQAQAKEALEKQAKQKEALELRARRMKAMRAEKKQDMKKVLEMRAKWKEALEMQKQALEQEARAPEKQAKESQEKYKQMQAKLALMEEAKMKPAPIEDLNDCDIFGSN